MKRTIATVAATATLLGCAVGRTDGNFIYSPAAAATRSPGLRINMLAQHLEVRDNRKDPINREPMIDKRVLLNKRDGHFRKTEGVFAIATPLAEPVRVAFENALLSVIRVDNALEHYKIVVRIDDLDDELLKRGILSSAEISLSLYVAVTIVDLRSGIDAWRGTIRGSAPVSISGLHYSIEDVLRALPSTLESAASQFTNDEQASKFIRNQ